MLLAFAPWFSASAVAPLLATEWHTTGLDLPLLTVAVQVGFAVAAIVLAVSGAADVVSGRVAVRRRRARRRGRRTSASPFAADGPTSALAVAGC